MHYKNKESQNMSEKSKHNYEINNQREKRSDNFILGKHKAG
jgi:hypothetical protein